MIQKKPSFYSLIFKTSFINLLFIVLLVSILIKAVDGFTNPQLLQREYYYFYPELFDHIPLEEEVVEELDTLVEEDLNHWQPVTDQEFGYMGDSDMETPYLMEELYLVQGDIRDLRVQQEIIKNDMGIESPDSAICVERATDDQDPCNGLSDQICRFNEYCRYRTLAAEEEVATPSAPATVSLDLLGGEGTEQPVGTGDITQGDLICESRSLPDDKSCNDIYLENGGVGRGSCPYTCLYKDIENGVNVNGSLLL